ncbi:unnamed protein product [Calicophoron daubneyi]|uniref:J domain-containing protein n=1 Tax=Calicophoron daubneyi TaxID=300641 RepID=A0AAV2TCR4_CALDB
MRMIRSSQFLQRGRLNSGDLLFSVSKFRRLLSSQPSLSPEAAFNFLHLPRSSSPQECREAYLKMARSLHPDVQRSRRAITGSTEKSDEPSSAAAFQHLKQAYEIAYSTALKEQARTEKAGEIPVEPLIRHRAPQHRRYLESESRQSVIRISLTGTNPSERQRQVETQRFAQAAYACADYRVARIQQKNEEINNSADSCELVSKPQKDWIKDQAKKKPLNFIERVADEVIVEAMQRGEFDNLTGQGRPLPAETTTELFVDPSTKKISQILADQGYLPEWVELGKELRTRWDKAVQKLSATWNSSRPFEINDQAWDKAIEEFYKEAEEVNRLTDRYNLLVPAMHLQRFHVDASKTVDRIKRNKRLKRVQPKRPVASTTKPESKPSTNSSEINENDEKNGGSIWSTKYLGEIMRDFYRELARAYVSMMRGFKDHK